MTELSPNLVLCYTVCEISTVLINTVIILLNDNLLTDWSL